MYYQQFHQLRHLTQVLLPNATGVSTLQDATPNSLIQITSFDEENKVFNGTKHENFTSPTTGLVSGEVKVVDAKYYGAELKLGGQIISVWLFEQILDYMIEGDEKGGGGIGKATVYYSINEQGVPTYDLQDIMSESFLNQFKSNIHATVIYLINLLPKADNVTLVHEDSVKAIKAIYDKLGQIDKNMLQKEFAEYIGKLEGAVSKIAILKQGEELAQRPEGMDRYTKVIVNVVAPGGQVIRDFRGDVEITFNGVTRTVSFNTNTSDYNNNTGYPGSAVVYYDDIIYGNSIATAKIKTMDSRYERLLADLKGKSFSQKIFTNSKFVQNVCKGAAEVAYVVDHSGSTRKSDPNNYIAQKVKEMIRQVGAEKNYVYRFNTNATLETQGAAETVAATTGLLDYVGRGGGTNISKALEQALIQLSDDKFTAKAIVLVTDGKASKSKIDQTIKKAQEKGVKIYTVAVGEYKEVQEDLLRKISTETGGQYFNVTDVQNIHGVFQSIINGILCGTNVSDKSCLTGDSLFTVSSVTISRTNVILDARIATHCDNVYAVAVIFTTTGGSVTYDLQHRGSTSFRLTRSVNEFKPFSLYTDVEFQAYDNNGTIIASKTVELNAKN